MSWKYKEVRIVGHPAMRQNGMVLAHRAIAERMLRRPLSIKETVHHIDNVRDNNNPENLMVFATRGDHACFHITGEAILTENGTYVSGERHNKHPCRLCGTLTWTNLCYLCAMKQQRKAVWPSRNELQEIILTTSFVRIGMRYGVSDNAVRKWAKSYGLPTTRAQIRVMKQQLLDDGLSPSGPAMQKDKKC